MSATAAKICQACKQDCSAKPRTKDTNGQYWCNECVAAKQAQAAKPAAAAATPAARPAPAVNAVMKAPSGKPANEAPDYLWGGTSTAAKGAPCPSCATFMKDGSKVCTQCGYDVAAGRRLGTKITKEKLPKAEKGGHKYQVKYMSTWTLFGILTAVYVALALLPLAAPELALVTIAAIAIGSIVAFVTLVFSAFGDGNTGWGVICLLNFVPGVNLVASLLTLFYAFFVNERPLPKALYGAIFVSYFVLIMVFVVVSPELIEKLK